MALARKALAPPPLPGLPAGVMLAVATVPGKIPEEWQPEGAWPFWIAWPHAAGAPLAEVMTAGQLRADLAARDARLAREVTAAGRLPRPPRRPGRRVKLLDRLTRCGIHDRPLPPLKIAEMEEAAGIRPGAVAELWAASDFIPSHYDPDLTDCGSRRCRMRRGLP